MDLFASGDVTDLRLRDAAVIDVGSNSVRLVIYRMEGRAIVPALNEKVLAGLGRGVGQTGRLNPEGVEQALASLARFRMILNAAGIRDVETVATAAVRDASDGAAFVARAARETGLQLRVISGAEEARLSALGVLAGMPQADGLAGDLGGSSLELVRVTPDGVGDGETFPLGPLAMDAGAATDVARQRQMLVEALRASQVLPGVRGGAFYAVGGAWRALARIDMQIRDYPLKILHHYVIPRAEALTVADFVARQSRKSLERLDGAAGSRAETLPHAANLLAALIEAGDLQKVVISAFGLREGALFARMTDAERDVDPMVAGAAAIAGGDRRMRAFAVALDGWIAPAFAGLPELFAPGREALIRRAACHLADLGARLHPDHRGDLAFELVLRAPYAGLDHAERAFLALCAFHRYSYRGDPPARMVVARLLDEEQRVRARAAGAAMRLGADLSGRNAGLLATCALRLNAGRLTLEPTPAGRGLVTEQVRKRLSQLAAVLGLEAIVR